MSEEKKDIRFKKAFMGGFKRQSVADYIEGLQKELFESRSAAAKAVKEFEEYRVKDSILQQRTALEIEENTTLSKELEETRAKLAAAQAQAAIAAPPTNTDTSALEAELKRERGVSESLRLDVAELKKQLSEEYSANELLAAVVSAKDSELTLLKEKLAAAEAEAAKTTDIESVQAEAAAEIEMIKAEAKDETEKVKTEAFAEVERVKAEAATELEKAEIEIEQLKAKLELAESAQAEKTALPQAPTETFSEPETEVLPVTEEPIKAQADENVMPEIPQEYPSVYAEEIPSETSYSEDDAVIGYADEKLVAPAQSEPEQPDESVVWESVGFNEPVAAPVDEAKPVAFEVPKVAYGDVPEVIPAEEPKPTVSDLPQAVSAEAPKVAPSEAPKVYDKDKIADIIAKYAKIRNQSENK